jgi:hypothetical protein
VVVYICTFGIVLAALSQTNHDRGTHDLGAWVAKKEREDLFVSAQYDMCSMLHAI